jgi:peroxiredoxin
MKTRFLLLAAVLALCVAPFQGLAAEAPAVKEELQALVEKVRSKLQEGKKTEADLADELKEFDAILARHKDEKTDDVAQVMMMKAMLYLQVLDETEKGLAVVEQLKKELPETGPGKNADKTIQMIKAQEEGKRIQRSLAVGTKFPEFKQKDTDGKDLSLAAFKGKVVLIDFWATWCGPCIAELPNVLAAYEKHHDKGFEIIGISLDKDGDKLKEFTKTKKMTWPQFFDGKGWENELAVKYGVNSIPATYLLDGEGAIIAKNLRGEELEKEVAKAVGKL